MRTRKPVSHKIEPEVNTLGVLDKGSIYLDLPSVQMHNSFIYGIDVFRSQTLHGIKIDLIKPFNAGSYALYGVSGCDSVI